MSELLTLAHGRYLLVQKLGEGGMATVFRGFDQRLQVWRAVKLLLPEYAKKKKILQRFDAEAQTMALLEHPNIVRVYDVGVEDEHAYIVMELVEGGSLVDWLETHGSMPARMAVDVIVETCQALQFAHQKSVIHRDIKPHNIMVDRDGVCRLTDFGIARAGDSDEQLTKTGAVMGTWGFMAPEQRSDAKHVDERADIYAIAATLYSLITDRTPMDLFAADQDASMLEGVPEALVPVLIRATEYKKERRYGSAQEFAAALLGVREDLPATPAGTAPLKREIGPLPPPPAKTSAGTLSGSSGARPAPLPTGPVGGTILPDETSRSGSHSAANLTMPPIVDGLDLPPSSRPTFSPGTRPDDDRAPAPARGGMGKVVVAGVLLLAGVAAGVMLMVPAPAEPVPDLVLTPAPTPGVVAPIPVTQPDAQANAGTAAVQVVPSPVTKPRPSRPGSPDPAPSPTPTPAPSGTPDPAPVTPPAPAPVVEAPPPPAPKAQCFEGVTAPTSVVRGSTLAVRTKTCKDGTVTLYYRASGAGSWFSKNLAKVVGSYSTTIPIGDGYEKGVEWYLSSDGATHGSAGNPKSVRVKEEQTDGTEAP